MSTAEICSGIDPVFLKILDYCRNLEFKTEPDYGFLKDLLKNLFKKHRYKNDFLFDWVLLKRQKIKNRMRFKENIRGSSSTRSQSKK